MELDFSNVDQIEACSNADGSNAIILPGKKKKETNKGSKKRENKQTPTISKIKLIKLKKMQEEKEKKLLHIKSIKILEKHKLSDGAYALLQSSGTIGQAETTKEKRRRAVQLLKAGLEVPDDLSSLKKKRRRNHIGEEEVIVSLAPESDKLCLQYAYTDNDKGVQIQSAAVSEILDDVDVESNAMARSPELMHQNASICTAKDQIDSYLIPCSYDEGNNNKFQMTILRTELRPQDQRVSGLDVKDVKIASDNRAQGHLGPPIVVHVPRPEEIEQKRRDLPIIMMEQEIMEAINEHSIVIICGETGCGKTTQVPQFLYEAGFGSKSCNERGGIIGVTQPRRIAAIASANRVSFELGPLGKEVGYQVRYVKKRGDNCSIKFMTDGILLRELQNDFLLKRYSVIILDEAHERSMNTDILVGMLSRIIKLRQKLYLEQQEYLLSGMRIDPENTITQLKLVLMSATLRVEDFISNRKLFPEAPPVLEVPGRQFPVTIHFSKKTHEDYLGQAYKKVILIHKRLPPGGILVFVTGQREVELLCKKLRKASKQFVANNSKRKSDAKMAPNLEKEAMDVSEAPDVNSSSHDQPTGRFSSFEEDESDPEIDFDMSYSETETESDFEDDTDEILENTDLSLDLLRDSASLPALKASFEAFAGKPCNKYSKEEPTKPVPPTTDEQAEPTPAGPLYVLPLYARLNSLVGEFNKVPEGERLVVIATNVAETSLTIPGIKYVVDSGKEKVKRYNLANGMETYEIQWISKASAAQRAGRAGRTGPGHCYRLYSSAAFSNDDLFPKFSCAQISKVPVDGVVLLMKSMGIHKVANFPFPTPPGATALVEAEHCLKALEALDTQGRCTEIGRAMAQYPMSPRHSRMLLTVIQIMRDRQGYARANLILGYAIATASALSFPNPYNMQFDGNHGASDDLNQEEQSEQRLKKAKAMEREARARFQNPSSDALTIAYALQLFEREKNRFEFCKKHSLHFKTMDDMSKLREQLLKLIFYQSKFSEEFGWNQGSANEVEAAWKVISDKHPLLMNEEELLGQAICAGWADRVAKRVRKVSESSDNDWRVQAIRYQSCALNDIIYLHRWSSVSQSAPEYVVYTELLQTIRPYMHGVTSVKADWLVKYATSLCTFSAPLTNPKPYYEPLRDEVLCWVNPIFGRHIWQLPLHSLPIKNDALRTSVFACALLEGSVLPCMRQVQKMVVMPPSTLLKSEALVHMRVWDLLNGLHIGSKRIDSRAMLREAWAQNPRHLYLEIKRWYKRGFHHQFEELWREMHCEVALEGQQLFPKKAKKDRRNAK